MTRTWALVAALAVAPVVALAEPSAAPAPVVLESVDVAPVWAGHPVGFGLYTDAKTRVQYVAYYDARRQMTLASRPLDSKQWKTYVVPSKSDAPPPGPGRPVRYASTILGWDSHNYIAITVDAAGQLHLSGNMHSSPLLYCRTTRAGDITSLVQLDHMVGDRETNTTYPRFFDGPEGQLVFAYRDGRSGNGSDIYDTYAPTTQTWKRLIDQPLLDGQNKMNAYSAGPFRGPDGYFHLVWIWRDTPDCSSCHDISYAKSKDLRHWESADGKTIELPMRLRTGDIVDPVQPKGGAINNNVLLGFDPQQRPVLSFTKYDAEGKTQLYLARYEAGKWNVVQVSSWDYRWEFSGGGSIVFDIRPHAPQTLSDGRFVVSYWHRKVGMGGFVIDPATLRPTGTYMPASDLPAGLGKVESSVVDMEVRTQGDAGRSPEPRSRYLLRWETLPANRDQARQGPVPEPSMLRVYKVRES